MSSIVPDPALNDWVPMWSLGAQGSSLSGTYATRPAANTVNAGTLYFATDTLGQWRSDGSAWTLVGQGRPWITSAQMSAAPFSSPYDGQEIALIADAGNISLWHLRYNASSASAYKWECLGGQPLLAYSGGSVSNGASLNTWTNIVSATLIIPRTGEYSVSFSCVTNHPTAGASNYGIMWIGGLPGGVIGPSPIMGFPNAGGYSGSLAMTGFRAQLSGGSGLGVAGQSNIANGNWSAVTWQALPLRVS